MHFLIVLAIVLVLFRFFPVTMMVLGAAFTVFVFVILYQKDADNAEEKHRAKIAEVERSDEYRKALDEATTRALNRRISRE
jgi:type III secretory pathway component EscV